MHQRILIHNYYILSTDGDTGHFHCAIASCSSVPACSLLHRSVPVGTTPRPVRSGGRRWSCCYGWWHRSASLPTSFPTAMGALISLYAWLYLWGAFDCTGFARPANLSVEEYLTRTWLCCLQVTNLSVSMDEMASHYVAGNGKGKATGKEGSSPAAKGTGPNGGGGKPSSSSSSKGTGGACSTSPGSGKGKASMVDKARLEALIQELVRAGFLIPRRDGSFEQVTSSQPLF